MNRTLLELYRSTLDVPDGERPSKEQAWLRYRATPAYGLAIWLSTLGTDGWQRPEVSLALAQRARGLRGGASGSNPWTFRAKATRRRMASRTRYEAPVRSRYGSASTVLGWMSCSSRMPLWFASMRCKARQ